MDDEVEVWQVEAACGNIGRHTDIRPSVAQRLKRMGAFGLAELTREGDDAQAAIMEARQQMVHICAGLAEDQRVLGFMEAQDVDDGILDIGGRNRMDAVVDIGVLVGVRDGVDADRIALERGREARNRLGDGGREQQRAALFRRSAEQGFQLFAEAKIQHFVSFIHHDNAEVVQNEAAAIEMVDEAARRADDDMRAFGK